MGEEDELVVGRDAEGGGVLLGVGRVPHELLLRRQRRRRRQHDRAVLVDEDHFSVCN